MQNTKKNVKMTLTIRSNCDSIYISWNNKALFPCTCHLQLRKRALPSTLLTLNISHDGCKCMHHVNAFYVLAFALYVYTVIIQQVAMLSYLLAFGLHLQMK